LSLITRLCYAARRGRECQKYPPCMIVLPYVKESEFSPYAIKPVSISYLQLVPPKMLVALWRIICVLKHQFIKEVGNARDK